MAKLRGLFVPLKVGTRDHPKTRRLARALGIHPMQALGHVVALWEWAMQFCQDGDMTELEPQDIAEGVEWDGDPVDLVRALLGCGPGREPGYLEWTGDGMWESFREDGTLQIYNWRKGAGKVFVDRAREAERKRLARLQRSKANENPLFGLVRDVSADAIGLPPPQNKKKNKNKSKTSPLTPLRGECSDVPAWDVVTDPKSPPPDPPPTNPPPDPPQLTELYEIFAGNRGSTARARKNYSRALSLQRHVDGCAERGPCRCPPEVSGPDELVQRGRDYYALNGGDRGTMRSLDCWLNPTPREGAARFSAEWLERLKAMRRSREPPSGGVSQAVAAKAVQAHLAGDLDLVDGRWKTNGQRPRELLT